MSVREAKHVCGGKSCNKAAINEPGRNYQAASDLSEVVKRILLENWDPTGVRDFPGA